MTFRGDGSFILFSYFTNYGRPGTEFLQANQRGKIHEFTRIPLSGTNEDEMLTHSATSHSVLGAECVSISIPRRHSLCFALQFCRLFCLLRTDTQLMDFIYKFGLGDIELTIISEGNVYGDPGFVFKGIDESVWRPLVARDDEGRLVFALNLVLVRTEDRLILLDTGIGEHNEARERFESVFPFKAQLLLLDALEGLEIARTDVTDVVFSHVHADHIMGATIERNGERIPTFPRAKYMMHRADGGQVPEREDRKANFNLHIPVLEDRGLFTLIEDGHPIAPGITAIHAPGESPGHILVRLESRGSIAYYVGDLFHDACEAEHIDFVWPDRDREDMIASRTAFIARAVEEDALIITAHTAFPGMARLEHEEGTVVWRTVSHVHR